MIPTQQDLRKQISERATEMTHPTKVRYRYGDIDMDPNAKPIGFGRIVYFEGGHVGVLVDHAYLIAEGDDHQDSILALAHHLKMTALDNGVKVSEVTPGHFWLRCAAGR